MASKRTPSEEWITTPEAARILCVSKSSFSSMPFKQQIRRVTMNRRTQSGYGGGWLWYRPDVEAVRKIRDECRIGCVAAIKVLAAMRDGRISLACKSAN